jgi:uncharacterized repeat protein (TIGR01451 family)
MKMDITKKHTITTGITALLLILGVFVSPSHAWPPCIDVWKWVEPEVSKIGDEVVFTICVKNCGEIHLRDVVVDDPLLGGILSEFPSMILVGSEPNCYDFKYTIQPDDPDPLENVVTANAVCRYGNKATDTDKAIVDLVVVGIDITKTVDNPNPCFGETITYTICIENTGEWPLEHIVVEDSLLGGILSGFPDDVLDPGEVACVSFEYEVKNDDPCPLVNCVKVRSDPWGPMTNCVKDEDSVEICPQLCDEGCTPGYWKNHPECWECFEPSAKFSDIFGKVITIGSGKNIVVDPTLMEALNGNGGGVTALARHAVAAILNACDTDIAYPMGIGDIIAAVAAVLESGEPYITDLKDILDEFNNLGCPQDAHCYTQDEERTKQDSGAKSKS